MMQEIECYRERWIVYSLGNFVFNSRGRFAKYKESVPFGLAARVTVLSDLELGLRVYPLLSDNLLTDYRPRPVTREEAARVRQTLLEKSMDPQGLDQRLAVDADDLGSFLLLSPVGGADARRHAAISS